MVAKTFLLIKAYSLDTDISLVEPAHIIQKTPDEFRATQPMSVAKLPTLAELRAKYPKPGENAGLTWDSCGAAMMNFTCLLVSCCADS